MIETKSAPNPITAYAARCGGSQMSQEGYVLVRFLAGAASADGPKESIIALAPTEAMMLVSSITETLTQHKQGPIQ